MPRYNTFYCLRYSFSRSRRTTLSFEMLLYTRIGSMQAKSSNTGKQITRGAKVN